MSEHEIVEAVRDLWSPDEPVTTSSAIAERVDMGQRAVQNRLPVLVAQGALESQELNARQTVYWPADVQMFLPGSGPGHRDDRADDPRPDRVVDDDQEDSHRDDRVDDDHAVDDDQEDSDAIPDELQRRMERKVTNMEIKGRPRAVKRARREALIYAWDRLREEGEMQPKRLADDVIGQFFDNPDLNYSVSASGHPGYQLLDNFLRDAMLKLPGVHSTGRVWQFREDKS